MLRGPQERQARVLLASLGACECIEIGHLPSFLWVSMIADPGPAKAAHRATSDDMLATDEIVS
ncbi:hypothetical protein GCM10009648_28670 [Tsukamurella spumae]